MIAFGWFILGFCAGGAAAFLVFFGMERGLQEHEENQEDEGYF